MEASSLSNYNIKQVSLFREATIEAKQHKYAGFIIEEYLPDGAGIDLAIWLRKQFGRKVRIALISGEKISELLEHQLKQRCAISFVKPFPNSMSEINEILNTLIKAEKKQMFSSRRTGIFSFQDIKKRTLDTILASLEILKKQIRILEREKSDKTIKNIKDEIARIKRLSASYDNPWAAELCAGILEEVKKKGENVDDVDKHWIATLFSYYDELLGSYKIKQKDSVDKEPETGLIRKKKVDIFYIDDDKDFLNAIEKKGKNKGLTIETEVDPKKAMERLSDTEYYPKFILVDKYFPGTSIDGYDLANQFRRFHPKSKVPIGMISVDGNIGNRTKAIKAGIELFFQKPISPNDVINDIAFVLKSSPESPYKVLIVDDDQGVCEYSKLILKEIGVEAKTLLQGSKLLEAIEDFNPNLLLLDIVLPDYNGLELLEMIRTDSRHRRLPVIIVTGDPSTHNVKEAYSIGVEDFIVKPLVKEVFQAKIKSMIQKQSLERMVREFDSLTGLLNRREFISKFQVFINNMNKKKGNLCVALIDLDRYKQINDTYGHNIGDDVLTKFAGLLQNSFRSSDLCARWGGDEFIIAIHDMSVMHAGFLLGLLLDDVRNEVFIKDNPKEVLTFSCGITQYPEYGSAIEELAASADKALYNAKNLGRAQISLTYKNGFSNEHFRVRVLLKNQELSSIIINTLRQRGLNVCDLKSDKTESSFNGKTIYVFSDEENGIEKQTGAYEMKAEDDGMIILSNTLKQEEFKSSIPFVILSKPTSLQDLLDSTLFLFENIMDK